MTIEETMMMYVTQSHAEKPDSRGKHVHERKMIQIPILYTKEPHDFPSNTMAGGVTM